MRTIIFVAILVGCQRSAPISQASAAAGSLEASPCYELRLGTWTPATEPIHPPPRVIRLDSLQFPRPVGSTVVTRRLEPDIPTIAAILRRRGPGAGFQFWERYEADSLRLVWSTGFEGTFLLLRQSGDSLSGRAIAFVDYPHGPFPNAPVTGLRVPCMRLEQASR